MSLIRRIFSSSTIVCLALAGGVGCGGGSTNNDQGTSFLATGYFVSSADGAAGASGGTAVLSLDVPQLTITTQNGLTIPVDGAILPITLGVQNRLSTQFINVTRVDCTYSVPGSSLAIPNDSIPVTLNVGSAGVPVAGASSTGGTGRLEFPVITADMFAFLNTNRDELPELPFRLIATCTAVGISQAGDVFQTNPAAFPIFFFDSAECCTGTGTDNGGGFQEGTGVGGEFDSFGDPTDSTSSSDTGTSAITDDSGDFVIE